MYASWIFAFELVYVKNGSLECSASTGLRVYLFCQAKQEISAAWWRFDSCRAQRAQDRGCCFRTLIKMLLDLNLKGGMRVNGVIETDCLSNCQLTVNFSSCLPSSAWFQSLFCQMCGGKKTRILPVAIRGVTKPSSASPAPYPTAE